MEANVTVRIQNNELIVLLKDVLEVCDGIRCMKADKIEIRIESLKKTMIWNKENGLSEDLMNYVFVCASKSVKKIVLCDCENLECKDIVLKGHKFQFKGLNDSLDFNQITQSVNVLFIDAELKEELIRKLTQLENHVNKLNNLLLFPNRELMKEYLLIYTDVLTFLLKHEIFLDSQQGRECILKPLLNCTRLPDGDEVSTSVSLLSPISVYLLLMVYYRLDEYINIREETADLMRVYKEIFEKKVLHAYRWLLADENHKLYHAALTPFVEKPNSEGELLIPVHSLEKYNSFEGIRELRLAEKIIFGLDEYSGQEKFLERNTYRVAMLGDLQREPVEELGEYLSKLLEKQIGISPEAWYIKSNVHIHLDIYTKTKYRKIVECQGRKNRYSYEFQLLTEHLTDSTSLNEVLCGHEQIFMLDNLDLYKGGGIEVEEYVNPSFYKQRLKDYDYGAEFDNLKEKHTIANGGAFKELHELLTAYLYSGKWGIFKKTANDQLLQFIEEKIRESNSNKSIYVYVSDLNAFHELYCNDKFFVRKEQYCDKEIGIIRYSKRVEEVLKNKNGEQYILVFNIWQFVKHIVIEQREYFLKKLLPGIWEEADLKQIYISIQYDKWRETILLDYYLENEAWEQREVANSVHKFMKEVLLPVFNGECDVMYQEYIYKAICSYLYGDVANIEDMLFVHLFKNHRKLLGKVEIAPNHQPTLVKKNINLSFKYSFKRFYAMAMENFDISASQYIEQFKTVQAISESEKLKLAWVEDGLIDSVYSDKTVKATFFQQLCRACENLDYTNSYLYKNCLERLKEN